jgi:hypothetical protein
MILSYIDPKFCNIISFQSNLGHFSKNIAISLFKSQSRVKSCERVKVVDRSIQTTLYDFGLKSTCKKIKKVYNFDIKINKCYLIVNLDYWIFDDVEDYVVVDMGEFNDKKVKFYDEVNKTLYNGSVGDILSNVHILSDGSFEMLNPRCSYCGSFDVVKKDFVESKPKVEYHGNMKLKSKRYYCKSCGTKFQTKIASVKDDNKRFSKDLKDKVRESFANRGGSFGSNS